MTASTTDSALRSVRIPGEFGPILRCFGELSCTTAEALRHELAFLESLDHPAITLNLSGCDLVSPQAIGAILFSFRRLREQGHHLLVVVKPGRVPSMPERVRLDQIIPVFPTEEAAALAFRSGPALPAPPTWAAARAETVAHWSLTREVLDQKSWDGVLRLLTSLTPLCERSEELFREGEALAAARCEFCPLFHRLGGERTEIGCASLLNPIIAAVRARDINSAGAQVTAAIDILSRMPLPEVHGAPGRRS